MFVLVMLATPHVMVASACEAPAEWCLPMPTKSYFGFPPPTDEVKWRSAQIAASRGEHSLLQESLKHFTTPNDFVDGDTAFKYIHYYVDVFLDKEIGFGALTNDNFRGKKTRGYWRHDSYAPATRIPIVMAGYGWYLVSYLRCRYDHS